MKAKTKIVSEDVLQEIVRRIVAAVQPEKIIFRLSGAGRHGPDSDLDLLVIKSCNDRRRTARRIRRRLVGIGVPKDIIVATPEDLECYKDTVGLIYRPALKEGKVLYAA